MTTLSQFFDTPKFSDVTIVVGKHTISAHRVILAQSDYFSAILSNGMVETKDKDKALINLKDMDEESVLVYLRFLYDPKTKGTVAKFGTQDALKILMDTRLFLDKKFISLLWAEVADLDKKILSELDPKLVVDILDLGRECNARESIFDGDDEVLLKLVSNNMLSVDIMEWLLPLSSSEMRLAGMWLKRNPETLHNRIVAKLPKQVRKYHMRQMTECLSGITSTPVALYLVEQYRQNQIGIPKTLVSRNNESEEEEVCSEEEREEEECSRSKNRMKKYTDMDTKWEYCKCGNALATHTMADDEYGCFWCAQESEEKARQAKVAELKKKATKEEEEDLPVLPCSPKSKKGPLPKKAVPKGKATVKPRKDDYCSDDE